MPCLCTPPFTGSVASLLSQGRARVCSPTVYAARPRRGQLNEAPGIRRRSPHRPGSWEHTVERGQMACVFLWVDPGREAEALALRPSCGGG